VNPSTAPVAVSVTPSTAPVAVGQFHAGQLADLLTGATEQFCGLLLDDVEQTHAVSSLRGHRG